MRKAKKCGVGFFSITVLDFMRYKIWIVFSSSLLGKIITVVEGTHFFVVLNRIGSEMVSFY